MRFNLVDGSVGLYLDETQRTTLSAISTLSYNREKGPKVLSQISSEGINTRAYVDANLPQFKNIIAIDTNYKSVGADKVCVVAAIVTTPSMHLGKVRLKATKCLAIEFWNPLALPERIGWRLVMDAISDTEEYKNGGSFGVIVDSELGNINSFNTRELDILPKYRLPDRMTMIYGSSDKKTDSAINRLIHLTDAISKSIHSKIELNNFSRSGDSISNYFTDEYHWENVGQVLSDIYSAKMV